LHKIDGGQSTLKLLSKRKIQGGQCLPKLFPGWAHAHPAHPVSAPMLGVHLYADDVQLKVSRKLSIAVGLVNRTLQVIGVIQMWMSSYSIKPDKTQFIWLGTSTHLAKRDVQHLTTTQSPSNSVSNLGSLVDSELTFRKHVTKLCQQSFFHLCRLCTVRDSLTLYSLRPLVNSFVCNRWDYCNGTLFGTSSLVLSPLQSIQTWLHISFSGS